MNLLKKISIIFKIMKLWIARDSYGLWLFDNKPEKVIINGDKCCKTTIGNRYTLDDELFPKITFENSPMLADIELVKEGVTFLNHHYEE